jgi:phage shock protein E
MSRLIVDVREPNEYDQSHVEGAINLPLAKLIDDIAELKDVPKDTQLILYCRSGNRSAMAMQMLQTKGFTRVVNGINQDQVIAKYIPR